MGHSSYMVLRWSKSPNFGKNRSQPQPRSRSLTKPTLKRNPELDFERIRILYSNVKFGYLGVISSVSLLYFVVVKYATPELGRLWILVAFTANIPRLIVSFLFEMGMRKERITPEKALPWEKYMLFAGSFAYLGFVSVIFFPFGENAPIAAVFCAFTFMIMT